MKKKVSTIILGVIFAFALCLAGCGKTDQKETEVQKAGTQESPNINMTDKTVVVQEDNSLRTQLGAPESTQFELIDEEAGYIVKVNAPVNVPDAVSVSTAKVKAYEFTNEDTSLFTKTFFGDNPVESDEPVFTKEECQLEIDNRKKELERAKERGDSERIDYWREEIDGLEARKAEAPDADSSKPVSYEFTMDEHKVVWLDSGDEVEMVNGVDYNQDSFSIKGEVEGLHAVLEMGKGGLWNRVSYRKTGVEYISYHPIEKIHTSLGAKYKEVPNSCKYAREEAVALCEEALTKLGIKDDFDKTKVTPLVDYWKDFDAWGYDSEKLPSEYLGYEIEFGRNINGILETYDWKTNLLNDSDARGSEEHDIFSYGYEEIRFYITDDGIVYFNWSSPMKTENITAEDVQILPYEQIEEIFKEQFGVLYAKEAASGKIDSDSWSGMEEYPITEVRLGMMRVGVPDSQNNYSMIPVWDFVNDGEIVTINAIDGSIIDRSIGY